MILPKYEAAFAALTSAEVHCVVQGLASAHPELLELGDFESGAEVVDFCRYAHVSQAEVIMGMARMTTVEAISAVEKLCLRPIDRRSPAQVERERDAARGPRPTVAPVRASETLTDQRVIRVLVDKNPKRAGTKAHERFALYRDGMTVAEFVAAGGTRDDLAWDQPRGFVRIDDPDAVAAE